MSRLNRSILVLALALAACAALAGCTPVPASDDPLGAVVAAAPLGLPRAGDVEVQAGLVYSRPDGDELALDACLPATRTPTARPAVIFIHGGSWARGSRDEPASREVCEWLAAAGYPTFSMSYRLSPAASFPAANEDARAALAWIREPAQLAAFGIDPARIALLGSSAGGTLAAWVGTAGEGRWSDPGRVAAVIELSAPIDLSGIAEDPRLTPRRLDYLGCSADEVCASAVAASPHLAVDPTDPPTLIVHATEELVPLAHAELFVAALETAGVEVELVVVPGDRHATRLLDAERCDRILAFLARTVGGEMLLAAD